MPGWRPEMRQGVSAVRAIVLAGCGAWPGRRPRSTVPVLAYHSIDASGSRVSVAPGAFRRQMDWLKAHGYQALTVSELADALHAGGLPARSVAVTFDDAYRNVFEVAIPYLQGLGFRATVFVPTDKVGRYNDWSGPRVPRIAIASWDEIRTPAAAAAIEVGAHGCTHARLGMLPREQAGHEVTRSREELQSRLGLGVSSFCYPWGMVTAPVRALVVDAGYRAACTTKWGHVCVGDDPFLLRRIDVHAGMLFGEFRASLTPAVEQCRALWERSRLPATLLRRRQ